MRIGFVLAILLLVLGLGRDAPQDRLSDEMRTKLSTICKHFVNRARFMPRHAEQPLVVTLADGCSTARESLNSTDSRERIAALGFLTRLRVFRDTVIDMNMMRVFGDKYTPFTRMPYGKGAKTESVRKVSGTGEYLIAYQMGLLKAYHAWLDTAPQMAFVLPKGPRP